MSCPLCNCRNIKNYLIVKDMRILKCFSCGMVFQNPESVPKQKESCYTQLYSVDNEEERKLRFLIEEEDRFKNIIKFIGTDLQGKRVLELGSGMGVLADILEKNGVEYKGIEPSQYMYSLAIKCYPHLKDDIENTSFENLKFNEDYFDLILMIDTFEHIPNPLLCLKLLKRYLKKKGIIYTEIPNESLLKFKGLLRRKMEVYLGYPTHPSHISLFTEKTFKKIFEIAGFKLIALFQITVWGNQHRLKLAIKNKIKWWMIIVCKFFYFTKFDLFFKQGNLIGVAIKDE